MPFCVADDETAERASGQALRPSMAAVSRRDSTMKSPVSGRTDIFPQGRFEVELVFCQLSTEGDTDANPSIPSDVSTLTAMTLKEFSRETETPREPANLQNGRR